MVLFSGLHGAERPVLGRFCKPHFPLALPPEPFARGYADPRSCTPQAAEPIQQGRGVLS